MKHVKLPEMPDPKRERRVRDARRGRLGAGRYDALVKDMAAVIRMAFEAGATGSLWGMEGPLRAGIREDLCLQGWGWLAADLLARDMVEAALQKAGARLRPDWNEGQEEWTMHAGTLIERLHCVRCHKPLPEGRPKFCSDLCGFSQREFIGRMKQASEDQAVRMAVNSIWT